MSTSKTHWRVKDYRIDSLTQIIIGLESSVNLLEIRKSKMSWYDALWFLEDSEQIYGLAFIAFQNYINGSIKDLQYSTNEKAKFYKLEGHYHPYDKSAIELIIGLANYIKHKDDSPLHRGTQNILDCFDLGYSEEIDKSPIFQGLSILSSKWNLREVMDIVRNWRKRLFDHTSLQNQ